MSVGGLSCFLSYANQYTKPFNEISGVITELQNALACAARIFELIEEDVEIPDDADAVIVDQVEGKVTLKDVDFSYLPEQCVPPAPLYILEGSYSLHPALQTDFAVRVFVTCPPDVQTARLRAREGIRYANFAQRWIPLEEGYFAAHDPAARCNFVLDTAEIFV
jgi:ABC-type multidrug transport system fused ATPase/permease subunit